MCAVNSFESLRVLTEKVFGRIIKRRQPSVNHAVYTILNASVSCQNHFVTLIGGLTLRCKIGLDRIAPATAAHRRSCLEIALERLRSADDILPDLVVIGDGRAVSCEAIQVECRLFCLARLVVDSHSDVPVHLTVSRHGQDRGHLIIVEICGSVHAILPLVAELREGGSILRLLLGQVEVVLDLLGACQW